MKENGAKMIQFSRVLSQLNYPRRYEKGGGTARERGMNRVTETAHCQRLLLILERLN